MVREVEAGQYPTIELVDKMLLTMRGEQRIPDLIDSLLEIRWMLMTIAAHDADIATAALTAAD